MAYIIYNIYKPTDVNTDADAGRKSTFNPVYEDIPSCGLFYEKA